MITSVPKGAIGPLLQQHRADERTRHKQLLRVRNLPVPLLRGRLHRLGEREVRVQHQVQHINGKARSLQYNQHCRADDALRKVSFAVNSGKVWACRQSFSNSDLFIKTGFLTLQSWVDNVILQVETADSNSQINANLASVRIPKYINDDIALYLQGSTNIFLVLPLILPFLRMIYRLLYEKVSSNSY